MSDEDAHPSRRALHHGIETLTDALEELDGAVLAGWVVIADWVRSDGERMLTRIDGTADPSRRLASWQRAGYLHDALYDWPDELDEDDE